MKLCHASLRHDKTRAFQRARVRESAAGRGVPNLPTKII